MRLALYNPKAQKAEMERRRAAGEVLLRLWQDDGGVVFLVVTDEHGTVMKEGLILRVNPNGTFSRIGLVNNDFGLPLTDGNKVIVE
jgi:hypothetical protein